MFDFLFQFGFELFEEPSQTEAQKYFSAILMNIFVSASKGVLKFWFFFSFQLSASLSYLPL